MRSPNLSHRTVLVALVCVVLEEGLPTSCQTFSWITKPNFPWLCFIQIWSISLKSLQEILDTLLPKLKYGSLSGNPPVSLSLAFLSSSEIILAVSLSASIHCWLCRSSTNLGYFVGDAVGAEGVVCWDTVSFTAECSCHHRHCQRR